LDAEAVLRDLSRVAKQGRTGEGDEETVVALVGPTASGKTELAVALAERVGGEVISVDSVQVYARFDIGSGKPTQDELSRAPHHLVGIKDAHEAIDAAAYAELAHRTIVDIRSRGKVPIVCGGTFLWVKALLQGLAEAPTADAAVRARHHQISETSGRAELHKMLAAVDPQTAARLHPNDQVRVSRALEVHELTGETMSSLHERHAFRSVRHPALLVARRWAPEELTVRIERRVDAWLALGWVEEVRALRDDGYESARAMGSVGYREVMAHVRGEVPLRELPLAITRATRVFARRQKTWLNHAEVTWV
jgi:tRNA dimethylallyltransferase